MPRRFSVGLRVLGASLAALALAIAYPASPGAISSSVVISQVYGGGGNSGATIKNDFIELFSSGPAPVNVTGWSVQYASATGSSWAKTDLTGARSRPAATTSSRRPRGPEAPDCDPQGHADAGRPGRGGREP